MSSLIGGRSGNRGACAGCCRLPYDLISDGKVINKDKYLISTKDLMTLDNIGELIDAGIESFKIEGRMKRPEYVFCIVSLYRKAIDSYLKNGYAEVIYTGKLRDFKYAQKTELIKNRNDFRLAVNMAGDRRSRR